MARRLPAAVQPFLTWLTAKPAPGEAYRAHTAIYHFVTAIVCLLAGVALSVAILLGPLFLMVFLPVALIVTTAGLGKLQVTIYHHCAHGTVLGTRERNRRLGSVLSVFLLIKHFDVYQKEHMLHHSAKRLLTEEDEFAQFLFGSCGLKPGLAKEELYHRVISSLLSPMSHFRLFVLRVQSCLLTHDRVQNWAGAAFWAAVIATAWGAGVFLEFAVVWLIPFTVLFQIATALRILCEHRFPHRQLVEARNKEFISNATAGVFPGAALPACRPASLAGVLAWGGWWAEMLTVHLFVRVFVLVGDAPCHDYHHRRPASKRWASYIHERQKDQDQGCAGFPINYFEYWGLFTAIDGTLETLSVFEPPAIQDKGV
ncbi:fatty acid desaturase [Rhodospirillaceae bacterium SYSU D60014]|uniref:fatty acid desaturase n=1 Tax=Virgifigura deserti TaxID=2268457 RepID=UPI0013C4479C